MNDASGGGGLSREALGGLVLIAATLLALVAANSSLSVLYNSFLQTPISVTVNERGIDKPLILWVNDGLMAVFFLQVGLELKAEMLEGRLRDLRAVAMPGLAALGGMVVPALIYLVLTRGADVTSGWAIPCATDIAFALGVLALVGRSLPPGLRSFLLTLAILDDLGAILIIALFYGHDLHWNYLVAALVPLAGMVVLSRFRLRRLAPVLLLGIFLWLMVLQSGIHATIAGVVTAFCVPMRDKQGGSPLHELLDGLHPYVSYLIVPLFAFANAGLPLSNLALDGVGGQVALGVGLGLLIGKFAGVMGASWGMSVLGFPLPEGMRWPHMAGVALLAGIGFTMSLFIGGLAFGEGATMDAVRLGVLSSSVVAALAGLFVLRMLSGHDAKAAV